MKNNGEEQKAHLIMKLRGQGLRSSKVLSAIENVPRDIFIEKALKNHAWENVFEPDPRPHVYTVSVDVDDVKSETRHCYIVTEDNDRNAKIIDMRK